MDSEDETGGFLSDGYDADFYGDAEDRERLTKMTEVEREAILYERAQARQARQERRALEQRIREREAAGKRIPSKEVDLKRKKLNELKAKRQKKLEGRGGAEDDSEEEGEFEDFEEEFFDESESEVERQQQRNKKKKPSRKHRKEDSDEDYYTEGDEEVDLKDKQNRKKSMTAALLKPTSSRHSSSDVEIDNERDELDLDMANKLRLTRDILAQWVYRDGFEDICQKCLLRINLGPGRTGQSIYRVVELKKIVQHHRTYAIKPGTPTNLAALVKFAKNERIFSFEFVSNSPFTESELTYWRIECEKAGVRLPYTNATARRKIDKLKTFYSEPLSDAVISSMLERRKELTSAQNAPRNLLAEQTILQQQLKEALERSNGISDEEVSRIENELAAIAAKRQSNETKDRLALMEDLNRRNRQVNLETGRQAEISRMQSELPDVLDANGKKKAPTLDPFQRRKCKPTIIHMDEHQETETEGQSTESQDTEANKEVVIEEGATNSKSVSGTNLFDAHNNFDLDLDI